MTLRTIALGGAALAAAAATNAQAASLDFDHFNGGVPAPSQVASLNGDEYGDFGVEISAAPNRSGTTLGLFNTNCGPDFAGVSCTGGDTDLATGPTYGTEPQGRALILNWGGATPNDDPAGGSIRFTFTDPGGVSMESVRLLDIDETDPNDTTDVLFEFEFFGGGTSGPFSVADLHGFDLSNTMNLSSIDLTGNNSFFQYGFRGAPGADAEGRVRYVSAFIVTYDDISGAIGGITYDRPSEVPLPAGLPLLLSGLAALGIAARRRRG